jgi:hypothetical protein
LVLPLSVPFAVSLEALLLALAPGVDDAAQSMLAEPRSVSFDSVLAPRSVSFPRVSGVRTEVSLDAEPVPPVV